MAINPNNSEFEIRFADSLEVLTNVEYLWSCSELPLSVEQSQYLNAFQRETEKLEALLQEYRRAA
jgi:hypothetical protein